jgi:hypothetical protein
MLMGLVLTADSGVSGEAAGWIQFVGFILFPSEGQVCTEWDAKVHLHPLE